MRHPTAAIALDPIEPWASSIVFVGFPVLFQNVKLMSINFYFCKVFQLD
jgi:hypothetical protein